MNKIQIILGSIRPGRNGEKVANWLMKNLPKIDNFEFELIDLKDWNLPLEIGQSPKEQNYTNDEVIRWSNKIKEADGYIIITPEYNHGYSAALKNALDNLYFEWNKKPVGFVGYGAVGGARVVDQLRSVVAELQMVSVQKAVHIISPWMAFDEKGNLKDEEMYNGQLKAMLDQLIWWTNATKSARDREATATA